ncbi:MAG: transposase [Spirochaetia bacterium]
MRHLQHVNDAAGIPVAPIDKLVQHMIEVRRPKTRPARFPPREFQRNRRQELTLWNFYFRLYPGAIKSPQVVDFLQALVRHIHRPLILVWDRLPAHRSRMVQDYIATLCGWIHQEYLPSYAPDLNPVEYIWAHWKQHELPNVCAKDYGQLSQAARRTLGRMRRRPRLIQAFWKQASLWPE